RISGGKPKMIIKLVTRMYQQNSGICWSDILAVRVRIIDTTSSTAADTAEISTKVIPSSQKSEFGPGEYTELLRGVYINQPLLGAMPNTRLASRIMPPNR